MILKASHEELRYLKDLLQSFSDSTGLKINYSKSSMVPLNLSEEHANQLAQTFGCNLASFPFTYLGLPLGTTKPRVEDYMPLMNNVERRLSSVSAMLTHAGRLQLVNSVLSSLPTYMMCTLYLPTAVLEFIDRARKHCLWRGNSDLNARGKALVAWVKVTKPKNKGGLGVINLRAQNIALLIKHLDKFYNRKDIPWVNMIWYTHYANDQIPHDSTNRGSFWWKDLLKLCDYFRGITTCNIGNGTTILFWHDTWNNHCLQQKFPRLHSFAKNDKISVSAFLRNNALEEQFFLPLSEEAFQEYQELQVLLHNLQRQDDNRDEWTYMWGSGQYSSKKFYIHPYKNIHPPRPFLWIWNSRCSNKLRVFTWLLLMDRLNTRNILRRKNFAIQGSNYSCVLCNSNTEETAYHLFFGCCFSQQCWQLIGFQWNTSLPFFEMLSASRNNFNRQFFMEVFIISAWSIWKQRNGLIFDGRPPTSSNWRNNFREECLLQAHRFKSSLRNPFLDWINSI
jgi:hypothetical protein